VQGFKQQAKMVGLDPQTLKPLGAPSVVPGLTRGFANVKAVLCSDTCRVVVQGLRTTGSVALSWAPGDSAATTPRLPLKLKLPHGNGSVIAASYDAGALVVAYWGDSTPEGTRIAVARGDARGAKLRLVSSIAEPSSLGTRTHWTPLQQGEKGALGADGFAAEAIYDKGRRGYVRVAVLPIRR
jgi:hypothetical protein